ncbi:MAG: SNF2-related protein, partial [Gammaproteobacteria bacterium]
MTVLYPFQKRGVRLIGKCDGRTLLADEMGLGKTIQAIEWMRQNRKYPAVVVCPAGLKYHWAAQLARHGNLRSEILETRKPPVERLFRAHRIVIVNYDILDAWLPFLQKLDPQFVVVDEGQCIKSMAARRTKAVHKLCKGVLHVLVLSGTPMTNRPADLFSSLYLLWPTEFPNFHAFGFRYCAPRRTPWGWDFRGATRIPELHERLKKLGMIRRLKKHVLKDLPDKTRIIVPLPIQDRKEYDKAEKEFAAWLREHVSRIQADKTLRAERLVRSGYLKRLTARLKLRAVMEWTDQFLEESDDKLILFAIHKSIVRNLMERYSSITVKLDGSITGRNRQYA